MARINFPSAHEGRGYGTGVTEVANFVRATSGGAAHGQRGGIRPAGRHTARRGGARQAGRHTACGAAYGLRGGARPAGRCTANGAVQGWADLGQGADPGQRAPPSCALLAHVLLFFRRFLALDEGALCGFLFLFRRLVALHRHRTGDGGGGG